ncbi:MAG: ATP-binding cassette domain-containing protein [Bacteroidota bacterium]
MANSAIHPFKRLLGLLKLERTTIVQVYSYAVLQGLVALSLPLGIQAIINTIQGGQVTTSWIVLVGFVLVGIAVSGFFQVAALSLTERIQQRVFTKSSFELAYRIPRMRLESLRKYHNPELLNRFFDTLNIQKGLSKILIDLSSALLQTLFGLILLSLYHPFFIIFGLLLGVLIFGLLRLTGPKGLRSSIQESKYKYEVAHWLQELARVLGTFKLAGKTELPLSKTDNLVSNYLGARQTHFRVLVQQYWIMITFKVLIAASLLIIGSLLVFEQQMNIGQFVAAEIIILLVIGSVEKLVMSTETIYDVLTALDKLGVLTDLPLESDEGEPFANIDHGKGMDISISNVCFSFDDVPGDYVLKDIQLEITSGEKLCVSGESGSGKSTLLQLIAGLYTGYKGSVSYNDIPLSNLDIESLHSYIGDSLSQEDVFQGSLYENISLGRPGISMQHVQWAVKKVNLIDFVHALPNGYNSILQPTGKTLSSRVIRKILIARSIVNRPRLLLIEDKPWALAEEDREEIMKFLADPARPWTLIVASNDDYIQQMCDRTVFLDQGNLISPSHSSNGQSLI